MGKDTNPPEKKEKSEGKGQKNQVFRGVDCNLFVKSTIRPVIPPTGTPARSNYATWRALYLTRCQQGWVEEFLSNPPPRLLRDKINSGFQIPNAHHWLGMDLGHLIDKLEANKKHLMPKAPSLMDSEGHEQACAGLYLGVGANNLKGFKLTPPQRQELDEHLDRENPGCRKVQLFWAKLGKQLSFAPSTVKASLAGESYFMADSTRIDFSLVLTKGINGEIVVTDIQEHWGNSQPSIIVALYLAHQVTVKSWIEDIDHHELLASGSPWVRTQMTGHVTLPDYPDTGTLVFKGITSVPHQPS